jgi:sugar phosphate isomerase/epimerase
MRQSPPALIEIAAAAGYEFVGLRLIPFGLVGEPVYALHSDPHLLRETRRAMHETGVRVLDMELARIHSGVDVKEYLPALLAGAELGVKHVLTSVWSGEGAFVIEQFSALCEIAEPLGMTVELEYVPYSQVRTLAHAAALVSACSRANAGICIDTLHFSRARDQVGQLARQPPRWFRFAQICDAPARWSDEDAELRQIAREGRLLLGQGGIDVRAILQAMPEMPYSIELPNSRVLQELGPQEYARQCLESARHYLQATDRAVVSRARKRTPHDGPRRGF